MPKQNPEKSILNDLKRPFHPSKISWRVGSTNKRALQKHNRDAVATKGQVLAYIDARDVMQRLDEVCGMNWQAKYDLATEAGLLVCSIGIQFEEQWIWRANGAGGTDIEREKGMASGAFKRAASLFGIGRYIYALPSPWIDLNQNGYLPDNFKSPALPVWATPEGFNDLMKQREESK